MKLKKMGVAMTLQSFLNKFTNSDFLLSVDGWCDELPFWEYEDEKNQEYWKNYKHRQIKSLSIITTNDRPELVICLEGYGRKNEKRRFND